MELQTKAEKHRGIWVTDIMNSMGAAYTGTVEETHIGLWETGECKGPLPQVLLLSHKPPPPLLYILL